MIAMYSTLLLFLLCCEFKLVLFQLDDLCVSKHKNERRVKSSDDDQSIVRWILYQVVKLCFVCVDQ